MWDHSNCAECEREFRRDPNGTGHCRAWHDTHKRSEKHQRDRDAWERLKANLTAPFNNKLAAVVLKHGLHVRLEVTSNFFDDEALTLMGLHATLLIDTAICYLQQGGDIKDPQFACVKRQLKQLSELCKALGFPRPEIAQRMVRHMVEFSEKRNSPEKVETNWKRDLAGETLFRLLAAYQLTRLGDLERASKQLPKWAARKARAAHA